MHGITWPCAKGLHTKCDTEQAQLVQLLLENKKQRKNRVGGFLSHGMGVPQLSIQFHGMFPKNHPAIWGYPQPYGTPLCDLGDDTCSMSFMLCNCDCLRDKENTELARLPSHLLM